MTSSVVNIEGELSRLASGTMSADAALEVSRRVMAVAKGAQGSQATAYHGRALYAQGRIADALRMFEDAWQCADQLDDPLAGALVTGMGGSCCATVYDFAKAEQWCARELGRSRSRLVANYRFGLIHLLASARMCQGDIAGARGLLGEFEGGASNHFLLAFHEGDWERGVVLRRMELEAERAAGRMERWPIAHRCWDVLRAWRICGTRRKRISMRDWRPRSQGRSGIGSFSSASSWRFTMPTSGGWTG